MSTMELDEAMTQIAAVVDAPAIDPPRPADPELRTYRGKTLEELLPKIRAELGPDAIVVRQRDGLMGGIGGFFQQQFVEVDAKSGPTHPYPRIDVYDEAPEPAGDGFAALLAAAEADAEPTVEARPDAAPAELVAAIEQPDPVATRVPKVLDALAESVREAALASPAPARARRPARKPPASRGTRPKATPPKAGASSSERLAGALTDRGLTDRFAARLLADAGAHELPFADDLRAAAARTLARRIPMPPPRRAGGMAIAFAGPAGAGKTHCVAALVAAYARTETPVLCITLASKDAGAELTRLLAPFGVEVHAVASAAGARTHLRRAPQDALVVLDTLAASPTDPTAIADLAEQLASFGLDETQLVVPATLDAEAALELHERLAPLRPTGITLTQADATDDRIGGVVELACATRLPLAYLAGNGALPGAIAPADPVAIAERLLP